MHQYIFFLLILFIPKSIIAQDQDATLIFTDGTSLTGYGAIKWDENPFSVPSKDIIQFRLTKQDKTDEWDGTMVDKIIFHGFEYNRTFQFVNIPFNRKPEYHLLELLEEGEVNLYIKAEEVSSVTKDTERTNALKNNDLLKTAASTPNYIGNLKVKRKDEQKFTTFDGSKKKIAAYFNNCSGIVSKLKSNEFNIGTIREIVSYYNDLCAGYEEETELTDEDK